MGKLWQRSQDENGKSKLDQVDLDSLRITKPTVVYISGFMTTDKQPGFIAGGLKRMEELLGHRADSDAHPVELLAWSHSSLANIFNLAAYNLTPATRLSKAGHDLARGLIMPQVTNAAGEKLPLDEAAKNLRNITLFGYSAGTIAAQECFNAAMHRMKKIGYSDTEARGLMKEVVLISTGNISRPSQEKDRYTTVCLAASNDRIIAAKNRLWQPLKTMFARFARKLNVKPLSDSSLFISAAVKKEDFEERIADGKTWRARIKPLIPAWMIMKSHHELPHYITHDENLSQFARIVLFSMTNAITRTARIAPLDLIQPPKGTSEEIATPYRERIKGAMVGPSVRV